MFKQTIINRQTIFGRVEQIGGFRWSPPENIQRARSERPWRGQTRRLSAFRKPAPLNSSGIPRRGGNKSLGSSFPRIHGNHLITMYLRVAARDLAARFRARSLGMPLTQEAAVLSRRLHNTTGYLCRSAYRRVI